MKKLTTLCFFVVIAVVLNAQVVVNSFQKISDTQGNFVASFNDLDRMGHGVDGIGDLDGDGIEDIVVGKHFDDDGGFDRGAVDIIFLNTNGTVKGFQKISSTQGGLTGPLIDQSFFGVDVANIGDLNGDGVTDIAVGAQEAASMGSVWILFLDSSGMVIAEQRIDENNGGFGGALTTGCGFGISVEGIGDLDNDGVLDLAVGTHLDDDGGTNRGAIWILFLNANGTVKAEQKISDTQGGFTATLDDNDEIGFSVAKITDINGDGNNEIITGTPHDDDGGTDRGALYLLYMDTNGTVITHQKISDTDGNFNGTLDNDDWFGFDVQSMGDVDNNGVEDIIVSARRDDDGGTDRGAVWALHLDANGTVLKSSKISDTQGGFSGGLDDVDYFGTGLGTVGDLNNDGVVDIAVGANFDDDGGTDRGAVWILFLDSSITIGDTEPTITNNQIRIYPNPTEGKFRVEGLELGVEKVEVYDLFGRLVLSSTEPQIDMRGYAKGVYFVKVGEVVRKLVVQ